MTEIPSINLSLYARTDVGIVRNGNEDNFLILDLSTGRCLTAMDEEPKTVLQSAQGYFGTLLAVSDGMGGALAGEVASRMAVETVRDLMLRLQSHPVHAEIPFPERLRVAIEQANETIHEESLSNPLHKGLGATFTAVATDGVDAYFAQVGDSRAYLIRRGSIHRITKDQSLVQQLIDAGQITEEEAETHSYRNVILQALGAHSAVNVEMNTISLCHLDILVICSDGLSGKISETEIADMVVDATDFQSAAERLIELANLRGGEDNITVVIAQFTGSPLAEAKMGTVSPLSLIRSPASPTQLNWQSVKEVAVKTDRGAADARPAPPEKVIPFTSPVERTRRERGLTNDLSDRRGPITAVFGVDDLATAPALPDQAPPQNRRPAPLVASVSSPSKLIPRLKQTLFAAVILVSLTFFGMGVATYFKRQENARIEQELQLNTQKEIQVTNLRQRLVELRNDLEMELPGKPWLKSRVPSLEEQLARLSERIDEVSRMDARSTTQIDQACTEINQELKNIEIELKNMKGFLPRGLSVKDPVRI